MTLLTKLRKFLPENSCPRRWSFSALWLSWLDQLGHGAMQPWDSHICHNQNISVYLAAWLRDGTWPVPQNHHTPNPQELYCWYNAQAHPQPDWPWSAVQEENKVQQSTSLSCKYPSLTNNLPRFMALLLWYKVVTHSTVSNALVKNNKYTKWPVLCIYFMVFWKWTAV